MNNKKIIIIILVLVSGLFSQLRIDSISPILKSAILPGWGELDIDNKNRSNQFFIQEASIWITYLGLKNISKSYESDYRAFATLHAGTDMRNKPYQYSVDIGDYNTYDEFVEAKKRNRQPDQIWPENFGYEWAWDSDNNRQEYDEMRIISGLAKKYSKFAIAAMIANRIVSTIDVLYLQNFNKRYRIGSSISKLETNNIEYTLKINF